MKKGYKECPFCANEIKEKAIKCQFCGEWLSDDKERTETIKEKTTGKSKAKETSTNKAIQKNDTKVSKPSFEESTIWTYIMRILKFAWHVFITLFFVKDGIDKIWPKEELGIGVAVLWIIYEIVLLLKDIKKIRNNQYIVTGIEKKTYFKAIIYSAIVVRAIIAIITAIGLHMSDEPQFYEIVYLNRTWNIIFIIISVGIFDLFINCINRKKVNLGKATLPSLLSLALVIDTIGYCISSHYYGFTLYPLLLLLILGLIPAICAKIFGYFYDKKNSGNTNKSKISKKSETKGLFANITMEKIIAKKKIIFIVLGVLFLLIISTILISKHHKKKTAENNCISNYGTHSILVKDGNNGYKCNCELGYDREGLKNKSKCISKKEISDRECKNTFGKNSHGDGTKALDGGYVCYCNDGYFFDNEDNPSKCTNDKELGEIYCKDFKNTYSDGSKNEKGEYICRCKTGYNAAIRGGECISSYEESKGTKECQKVFGEHSYSDGSKEDDGSYDCRCKEGYDRNKSNTKCIKK